MIQIRLFSLSVFCLFVSSLVRPSLCPPVVSSGLFQNQKKTSATNACHGTNARNDPSNRLDATCEKKEKKKERQRETQRQDAKTAADIGWFVVCVRASKRTKTVDLSDPFDQPSLGRSITIVVFLRSFRPKWKRLGRTRGLMEQATIRLT